MAHQAIYRKWRPMTFDDIVGQTHITKTLKNQILSDTVGHAYLFCGTRGTGKTTCAKVLSRAVNCLNPQNGNPCNECAVCKGIIDGSIMDVTEMDAASNNSVEDIRDIKDDINYVASNSKYTVYIIDEVHMLSTSAFNALLKTLEEPPENVIFILATTESHKVPQTILSRCQRFDFKRIRNEDIIIRMKEIAYADGYSVTDDAFRMLASLAEGSMRDGLSIMERVISASGNSISEEDIVNALGISTQESVFELTDAVINGDSAAVMSVIDKTLSDGKELSQLANSMLNHFRALMICKVTDTPEALLEYDSNTIMRIKSQSEKIPFEKINHASTLIANAVSDARLAKSARIIYELAFLKLTRPEIDRTPEGVMDRLAMVEQKLVVPNTAVQPVQSADNSEVLKRLSALENAIKNGTVIQTTEQEEVKKNEPEKVSHRLYVPIPEGELTYNYPTAVMARNWKNTMETMKNESTSVATPLSKCTVTFDAEGLIILVPDEYSFTRRMLANHIDELRDLFRRVTGTGYTIKVVSRSDLDERHILNPYELPKKEGETEQTMVAAVPVQKEVSNEHEKFDEFIEKFSSIITDADKMNFNSEVTAGEQSSFTDDGADDDREEFLEENELSSDDEDN